MLTDKEKIKYAELVNRCDPKWMAKADKYEEKQRSILRAIVSSGWSVVTNGVIANYHSGKHMIFDAPRVGNYLLQVMRKHRCNKIDIKTFPNYELWKLFRKGISGRDLLEMVGLVEMDLSYDEFDEDE
jgi:hypothetical protein